MPQNRNTGLNKGEKNLGTHGILSIMIAVRNFNVSLINQLVDMDISQIDELKNRIIELSIQCISDLKT